jgi:hypothetical protein
LMNSSLTAFGKYCTSENPNLGIAVHPAVGQWEVILSLSGAASHFVRSV